MSRTIEEEIRRLKVKMGILRNWVQRASGAVSSVFTRTGAVVAETNDYTWAQIDKTTSSIADITTKSHTALSDIGTNTHAQVDTHIAATAAHGATGANVGTTNIQTLTNKTIDLTSNTLVGSVTEFNTALEAADFYTTSGTDVAIADGGTGQSTQTAAMDALSPTTTAGDLLIDDGTNVIRLARGTDNQVLTATATTINWEAAAGGGSTLTQQSVVSAKNGHDSTTSTTFVDIPGATATFTPSNATNVNFVSWSGVMNNSAAGNQIFITLDVDGTDDNELRFQSPGASYNLMVAYMLNRANLSAASHTLKMQFRVDANTGSVSDDGTNFHYFTIQTFV